MTIARALDTVLSLIEVQKEDAYVRKASKGKRHLQAILYEKPDKQNPFYWVKVAEDNGDTYVSYFNFYVYPDGKILYLDAIRGIPITLLLEKTL